MDNELVRRAARNSLRALYWLRAKRLEIDTRGRSRSDYKGTWEALSERESDAKMFVASEVDEQHLTRSAEYTLQILSEKVGVNKQDRILEIGCGVGRVGSVLAPRCARVDRGRYLAPHVNTCPKSAQL